MEVTELWFQAVARSYLEAIKELLDQGADIDAQFQSPSWQKQKMRGGATALMFAVKRGRIEIIRLLIDRGAEFELQDNEGYTALNHAVMVSSYKFSDYNAPRFKPDRQPLQMLLDAGARFGILDAVMLDDFDVVRERIAGGSNINQGAYDYFGPLLLIASTLGHLKIVKLLLENGANPELPDDCGIRPLMRAVGKGCGEVVECLLEHGAKVDTWYGEESLSMAVEAGNQELVRLLTSRQTKVI